MPRRASTFTARPAAATATASSASTSTTTTTTIVANSTTTEGGSARAGPSSKTLPVSLSQAGSSATSASASASVSASKSGNGAQASAARPRRIMPSRSRRGGPGVGTSDVDTHILETLRRRRENEPLIPANAQFLLTTNSARVRTFGGTSKGADGESSSQLNTCAYERYFDKPEVIRAYHKQQLIQTPEFTLLSEHEAVGGRFRPRGLDDEGIDTSDAAYEKRHRKYESFEKRQRLREKEKLKHEHYKLKERIEQLRVLDPSTFLSSPDSFFAGSLRLPPHRDKPDAQGTTDVPATSHNEGEWRKRQMLDVANSLEARYRTLLDTVPSRAPDPPTRTSSPPLPPVPPSQTAPIPTSLLGHTPNPNPITTAPARTTSPTILRPQRVPSASLPLTEVIELDSDGEEKTPEFVKVESTTAPPVLARHDTTESLKLRIKFPNRPPPPPSSISTLPPPTPSPASPRLTAARIASSSPSPKASASVSSSPTRPRPKPIFKNPAAPSQYVHLPFVKRVQSQDVIEATVDGATPPIPSTSTLSPQQAASPTLSSNSAAHLTLRRRPGRTAVHPTSGLRQQPPPAHGLRLRKRRRIGLSDEDEDPRFDTDDGDDEAIDGATEDGREEEEGEEGEEEGSEEEELRARWRESALYREAQRHAGAPSARKTHRHLGIFGLKGFPAEVEHLREFAIPRWALPRGDPRVEREQEEERQVGRVGTARGSERVRRGGGGGGDVAEGVGQRRLRDAAAVLAEKGDGEEESSCSKSDQLAVVETASAVDS